MIRNLIRSNRLTNNNNRKKSGDYELAAAASADFLLISN